MAPGARRRGGCEQRVPDGAAGAGSLGPWLGSNPVPAPSPGAGSPRSPKMRGALIVPLLWLLLLLSPRDSALAARPPAPGYLITAPSVFRSGVEEVVSVTIFNSPGEVTVQAQLVAQGEAVAWSQGAILDKGTVKLKVPPGLRGQALLKVWGRSRQEEGPLFHNQTSVTLDARGASVFIQTDKPVYRPRHRVLISVFTVTPDLRPISEKLEAYILDPRGSRMMEWRHLEPVCCGITNMTFPLSDQPVLGEWLIFVEMQGHVYNRSFEVQKYALPKFELLIDPPRYIRDVDACETGTVQARYTFGKPVSGTLTINMTVNGVGYYSQEVGCPVLRTMKIHGSRDFTICVRDMIPADIPEHFRGTVSIWATVTTPDGSQQVAFDDSTPVQKQLVDIRYSKVTRKQFKPGLSYAGMVELSYPDGSPAEGVTVQIRAELTPKDNIYTTESVSRRGLVEFEIPSIPTSAQHVWLETKVTALNGKPVGTQYLPSYLSLSSWYSPSQCYLQLQPPSRPLQVGEEARFSVTSTCPCNVTLHYEVAARGNIVLSGQQPAHVTQQRSRRAAPEKPIRLTHLSETEPPPAPAAELSVCTTSLHLAVTPSMVPLSRLLVFYVRENGEGVADSLQFTVETFFENQVSLTYSVNETQPGEVVDVRVKAAPGSCACVAVVDKSVYLLRSGFRLTPAQVFRELEGYDVSDAFRVSWEDGPVWWAGPAARRRRRSFVSPWLWGVTKDSGFAFAETGLVVMTDLVSLNHRQDGGLYTDEAVHTFQPHTGSLMAMASSRQPPRAEKRRRTFFPETWVWRCLNISDPSGEETLSVQVPDSITSWVGEAVGLSSAWGLGIATPSSLTTFKPFFVDFTLPAQVVRGEQAKILLSIYNYMGTCTEVYVKISVPKGTRFVGHPGRRHLTRKMCVASGETEPLWVVLAFGDLGLSNITAKVLAYGETSCCRDGKPSRHSEESHADRRVPAGRDHLTRSVVVEPEGAPRTYTYSAFFCPNERVHISTPNKYEFQYVRRPPRLARLDLAVRAHNDARLALAPGPRDSAGMIEVVLGGHQNTRSWISTGKMGEPVASAPTARILSWDEFRAFWISWRGGLIQVGYGPEPSNGSVIVAWTLPKAPDIQFIGFSTGWGSAGEFRIWRKMEADESYSEAFTLGVPHGAIPGSERAAASLIGDVMGPTLNHLSSLLRLPFGCGEQNMIHFAPNVFVLKYLQKTRQLSPEVERETTDYLVQGYQRQLTYRRRDGSYSAFGERDASGSMWLTAFVLKSFAQARSFIFIDPRELAAAKGWIVRQQQADGSFPAVGSILNKDIQGGVHGTVPLTAYVVAALLEAEAASEEERGAIARAQRFLESSVALASDPYTSALTAYALTLLRSPAAPGALRRLRSLAVTQDGVTHWSLAGSQDAAKDTFLSFSDGVSPAVVSAEVEMTAYALLTYTLLGDVAAALPVVKWLSQQRNALGGFSSTQDTCVALQALAEYAILSYAGSVNLTISLASTNLDYQETFALHRANRRLLQTAEIPSLPTGLFVSAKGEGCCLLQIDVTYNVPDPVARPSFQLLVSVQEPKAERPPAPAPAPAPSADEDDPAADLHHQEYRVTLEVCTRWLHAGSSNMAVLEVPLLSGLQADEQSLEQLLLGQHVALKRYEVAGRRVLFYFDEIPSQCLTCVRFRALRQHVVGRTAALPVSVYDYYEPAFEATRFYNVSARSPLAQELCAGPACNEVERSAAPGPGWSPGERGPAAALKEEATVARCDCGRDCGARGEPVCGSDGAVYASACRLREAACRRGRRLEPAPPGRCALEQPMPASAYNYNDGPVPLDSGPLSVSPEAMDLEGEAEDSQSGFSS
ncbi:C3 and PZP-like alpha-2-macroglobulin domain-containing protein 8 [Pipistrellus kuhlii]|uniref:C3 and PZP like alpha-2-macroglobulin domain containing 8 n=1 Tax=Pipistrellus kuhlii TaxID=59472 RepID=A0A7J7S455_PIPKU|nr:C3 and PZP-like alpha-2-macroglobulin domain-containing protein 8 [Pipistrellus kuhlii]KAF6283246.1 C3 and PZP like alpha-2-macroglobulin domain containing 8 [Pipistrellus kuhlii]